MTNDLNNNEYAQYLNAKKLDNKRKNPLFFSILGLLLGPFMGAGIVFSILGLAVYLKNKKLGGTSLKWALVLGIVGLVLNVAFIVTIEIIMIMLKIPMPL